MPASRAGPAAPAAAARGPADGDEPLPDRDGAAAEQHPQRNVQRVRDAQPGEPGADEHEDQPLGALDDAAVDPQTRRPRRAP